MLGALAIISRNISASNDVLGLPDIIEKAQVAQVAQVAELLETTHVLGEVLCV